MYAKVKFVGKDGLGKPYEYLISDKLAAVLEINDFVVVQNVRAFYVIGVFSGLAETVDDPSIVTQSVVQRVDVNKYAVFHADM